MFLNQQTNGTFRSTLPIQIVGDAEDAQQTHFDIFDGPDPSLEQQQFPIKEFEPRMAGHDRRATGLMPMLPNNETSMGVEQSTCKMMLQSIQERQLSGYVHVSAEQRKSRSAILVFRGKALGCVYGNKQQSKQTFAEEAYAKVLLDLGDLENSFSTCLLNEELVVAAASLFHGAILHRQSTFGQIAEDHFNGFYGMIARSGMPGCIVLSGEDDVPMGMVYLYGGKIVGFYLHAEGWQPANWRVVLSFICEQPDTRLRACMIPITCIDDVERFTFSLAKIEPELETAMPINLVSAYSLRKVDVRRLPSIEAGRFVPVRPRTITNKYVPHAVNHAYDIDP